jgi:protein-disulfide isomerase
LLVKYIQDIEYVKKGFTMKDFLNQKFGILILALVIGTLGFVLGSLWTENSMLKQGDSLGVKKDTLGETAAAVPVKPDSANIIKNLEPVTDNDYIRGNKNAKITLIEYSDLECPFCKRFHITMQAVLEEYKDQVAWVYRHYPLDFHANAQKASEAAECVGKLAGNDSYWQFLDLYFEETLSNGTGVALDQLAVLGSQVGASQSKVQSCLDSDEMASKVKKQMAGGAKVGVAGTPGTVLLTSDGQAELISGALPLEQIKLIIEKYL